MSFVLDNSVITLDEETASRVSNDAAYLELAQRHRLALASLDRGLRAAALGLGLIVLGN